MIIFSNILIGIFLIALCMCLVRLIKGPTVFDRVLSLDGVAVCFVSIILVLSMRWETELFLDFVLIFSVLGFFSTVAFCYYIDRTYEKDENN